MLGVRSVAPQQETTMSRPVLMTALFALVAPLAARPEAEWKVPKTWKKVADAQLTSPEKLVAHDGWLAWTERKLIEETRYHRAQSFDQRLYRWKVDGRKVESLHQINDTGHFWPLLGPNGAVVTRELYPKQWLFLPGQKPVELPRVEAYRPMEFTSDGLLCHAQRYSGKAGLEESAITLIPITRGKAQPDDVRRLLPWVTHERKYSSFSDHAIFRRRGRLVYVLSEPETEPPKDWRIRRKPFLTVWDESKKTKAWEVEDSVPIAADARFVYSWDGKALVRRPLDGKKGEAGKLTIPGLSVVVDFASPAKLFGLFTQKDGSWTAKAVDLSAGTVTPYELAVPERAHVPLQYFSEYCMTPGSPRYLRGIVGENEMLPVAWDSTSGALYAAHGSAIYRVPAVEKQKAERFTVKWEVLR
jgi:hypothetical protein